MPFPATMYVDYIRVYQWNGQGEVHLGPPTPRGGIFGLFTDTTPTDGALVTGVTSEIYVWESTLVDGTIPPVRGGQRACRGRPTARDGSAPASCRSSR